MVKKLSQNLLEPINKISAPMKKACEMLLQIKELESKVAILDELSLILQKLTTKA